MKVSIAALVEEHPESPGGRWGLPRTRASWQPRLRALALPTMVGLLASGCVLDNAQIEDVGGSGAYACSDGAYENLFGMNVSAGEPAYVDTLANLGVRWARIEVRRSISSDFSHYRRVVELLHARGIKALLLVGYEITPGKPSYHASDSEWDAYRARFRNDLDRAGAALGGVADAFEVWNEPDHQLDGGYDPGVPARQFGLLLRDAAEILARHSTAPRIIGGMATRRFDYFYAARAAAGRLDYQGLGVHTYCPPEWSMSLVRAELDRVYYGWSAASGLPLWVTEAGAVATPTAEGHAAEYIRTLHGHTWNNHRSRVKNVFYFSWRDDVGFSYERFGLLRYDNSPKAGYYAYRDLTPAYAGGACQPPPPPQPAPTLPPEAALCVAPSGTTCRSSTLSGRIRAVAPDFGDCHVETGTCVQVNYAGCGLASCGWYNCSGGYWTCSDGTDCDDAAAHPSCSSPPPPPPSPLQWHGARSDRDSELTACAGGRDGGTLTFEPGAGFRDGHAACAALGYDRCVEVVDWECSVFSCDAGVQPSRIVKCQ